MNKKTFLRSSEGATANYDYTDIATGTGTIKYYFLTGETSTGQTYELTNETDSSDLVESSFDEPASFSYNLMYDKDFDFPAFNLPQNIRGKARAFFTQKTKAEATSNCGITSYLIIKIRKWDGVTETEIASGQGPTVGSVNGAVGYGTLCIPITIPRTHFKKGEILRVTIEGWAKASGSSTGCGGTCYIGHDPANRDSTAIDGIKPSTDTGSLFTRSYITIPYELDI